MKFSIQRHYLLQAFGFTKPAFMTDNITVCLKLIANKSTIMFKKNEQCHGKFFSMQIPIFKGETPTEDGFLIFNERTFFNNISESPSNEISFEIVNNTKVLVCGKEIINMAKDFVHVYEDVKIPTDLRCLHPRIDIPVTNELKEVIKKGLPFVRAIATNEYLRVYDGVMYFENIDGKVNAYSTDGRVALIQHTNLNMPTCLMTNDFLKLILKVCVGALGSENVVTIRKYELAPKAVTFDNNFMTFVYYLTFNNITFIHTRSKDEYAPMDKVDFTFDEANYVLETTVEEFQKSLETHTTCELFKVNFADACLKGEIYKDTKMVDRLMKYDKALMVKALSLFTEGNIYIMFKNDNLPMIIYNEKYTVYIKNVHSNN